jgi:RNA polymerase sigma-70 factor, ECF subfamily
LNEAFGRLRHLRPTIDVTSVENRRPEPGEVIPFPFASAQLDPERTMAQRQIQVLLERAIDDLPEIFRTVLVARVVEGMSVGETADLFGLRPETVKTRLHRARRLLRDALEKQVGPVLTDAFPFDGRRCERMTNKVLERLALRI